MSNRDLFNDHLDKKNENLFNNLKRELSDVYKSLQEQFIIYNKLKLGDTVRVTGATRTSVYGWGAFWNPKMTLCIGQRMRVCDIPSTNCVEFIRGIKCVTINPPFKAWYFPFYVLAKEQPLEFKDKQFVLVRNDPREHWILGAFKCVNTSKALTYHLYGIDGTDIGWNYCIPYEGNEHLLGTHNTPAD